MNRGLRPGPALPPPACVVAMAVAASIASVGNWLDAHSESGFSSSPSVCVSPTIRDFGGARTVTHQSLRNEAAISQSETNLG